MQNAYTLYGRGDTKGPGNQLLAKPHRAKCRRVASSIRHFCRYARLCRAAL